jgi:hypothetical protein
MDFKLLDRVWPSARYGVPSKESNQFEWRNGYEGLGTQVKK